jgi:prepilin-type N-terminal cleavage/methylation domain-containing protein
MRRALKKQAGFSLIELMIACVIFLLLCGAAFGLLTVAQERYQTESQVLNSFQEARFGLDQMVRDVNDSGYPPANQFLVLPPVTLYAATPVAWSPSYPSSPCQIGVNCSTPDDFDIIIETNIDPQLDPMNNQDVEWVRYQLQGTTLFRGVVEKTAGADPNSAIGPSSLVPLVQNVMNNAPAAQITQFRAVYPNMFPSGNPVPIFSYTCQSLAGPQPCPSAGSYNSPQNIQDVQITLIVMAPTPDLQTGQPRLAELRGRGHHINPNQ